MSPKQPPAGPHGQEGAKKTSAHYQREFRKRMREQGFVKKEVWIRPVHAKLLAIIEKQLRESSPDLVGEGSTEASFGIAFEAAGMPRPKNRGITHQPLSAGYHTKVQAGHNMTTSPAVPWKTETLFDALTKVEPFSCGSATIELIDGAAPALHFIMHEYGDLAVFLTVAGEQIIVEAVLWPLADVQNPALFNDAILRSHKYFPLSTISLDSIGNGQDYYYMFGALSSTSVLTNVIFEIEVLAFNVIQAAEAYSEFLAQPNEVPA